MSINLLETIQKDLNYPPLQKIDPNTQEVVVDSSTPDEHRFSQAAIPAVLTGLYTYSGVDNGSDNILGADLSTDWATEIFGSKKGDVLQKIQEYSFFQSGESAISTKINQIASSAIRAIREQMKPGATMMDVKKFLSNQTTNFLGFLPASLQMGQVVNEETLDDNTNKMEGPISSLMHKIGSAFSNPSNEDEVNAKP